MRGSAMAGLCGPFYFFSFVHNTVVAVCLRLDSIQDVNKADPSANTKPNQPTTWLIRCRPSFLSFSTLGGGGIGERFWTQELDANGASFASCLHGPTSNASLGEQKLLQVFLDGSELGGGARGIVGHHPGCFPIPGQHRLSGRCSPGGELGG